jgi:anti-sigma factor ChrR (cupin superfamily)
VNLRLHALFQDSKWQQTLDWSPFFERVDIHRLYQTGSGGPSAALIRFHPGGRVPLHRHIGYEHIVVLEGEQTDESGPAAKGAVIINAPGTSHSVSSQSGCIVLAIYNNPVRFLEEAGARQPSIPASPMK